MLDVNRSSLHIEMVFFASFSEWSRKFILR